MAIAENMPLVSNNNDEQSSNNSTTTSATGKALNVCGRICNVSALAILAIVNVLLFLQLQAVTYKVASNAKNEQEQIDDLKDQMKSQANTTIVINEKVEKEHSLTIIHMAGTFVLLTCLITMFHMTTHMRKFNEPIVQRKIVAILWMSPIYGVTSFLSLVWPQAHEYMMIIKDFYEAYCIYQFLSFLIAVLGRGDREQVVNVLARHADHLDPPYKCLSSFYHPHPSESPKAMSNAVLLECQILAMQFVFFRPFTSILNFVFATMDEYTKNGDADDDEPANNWAYFYSPQFFIVMVQNVSVFFAFAGLLKFYHAVRDDLQWCQPFSKFLCIKGVVFMTFWQGLAISIVINLHPTGKLAEDASFDNVDDQHAENPAVAIQNILICLEMLFFSLAHWCVFPTEEWEENYRPKEYAKPGIGFKDFVSDVNMVMEHKRASRETRKKKKQGLEPISQSMDDDDSLVLEEEEEEEEVDEENVISQII